MNKVEIQLSKEFKNQTIKAIAAISAFVLTYLVLLLLAILLTVVCIAGGLLVIAIKPMLITFALGIGLASLGVLVLIFLLKFIFKSHKVDRSHLIEITEREEPELFKMIREIVQEVGTSFPKKVYLSYDVNAAVFYDSSFWSMFLPVKKNLQIGLGLINTVTKEELKAILSHEFGHFSQRTMKVGSYVYNVNQIIFNILYENESYEDLIQSWGNSSRYFYVFVSIAIVINEVIQDILRRLYKVVNKSYMALSREMEFHADEIAASVTGYEPLKKSLLRMSLANNSFENVFSFYNQKISENKKSENVYKDQSVVLHFLAEMNNLPLTNNLPDISLEERSKFDKSKLVIKDQWASHPTVNERIARLEKTNFSKKIDSDILANEIFKNIGELQNRATEEIFGKVNYPGQTTNISIDNFIEDYKQEILSNSFDKIYNGYYDNKNPVPFDLLNRNSNVNQLDLEKLFSDEKVDLVYSAIALQNDLETLKNISDNSTSIETFDYDGVRYKKTNANSLIERLKTELENVNAQIKSNDIDIFDYFNGIEDTQKRPKALANIYNAFFEFDQSFHTKFEIYDQLSTDLQFVQVNTPFKQIDTNFFSIKPIEEKLKQEISELLSDNIFTNELSEDVKNNLVKYISKEWRYFEETKYNQENLDMLFTAINNYSFLLSKKYFLLKKKLLAYQNELLKTTLTSHN